MVSEPEDLYSKNGVLAVNFTYRTYQDDTGKKLPLFVRQFRRRAVADTACASGHTEVNPEQSRPGRVR